MDGTSYEFGFRITFKQLVHVALFLFLFSQKGSWSIDIVFLLFFWFKTNKLNLNTPNACISTLFVSAYTTTSTLTVIQIRVYEVISNPFFVFVWRHLSSLVDSTYVRSILHCYAFHVMQSQLGADPVLKFYNLEGVKMVKIKKNTYVL